MHWEKSTVIEMSTASFSTNVNNLLEYTLKEVALRLGIREVETLMREKKKVMMAMFDRLLEAERKLEEHLKNLEEERHEIAPRYAEDSVASQAYLLADIYLGGPRHRPSRQREIDVTMQAMALTRAARYRLPSWLNDWLR